MDFEEVQQDWNGGTNFKKCPARRNGPELLIVPFKINRCSGLHLIIILITIAC